MVSRTTFFPSVQDLLALTNATKGTSRLAFAFFKKPVDSSLPQILLPTPQRPRFPMSGWGVGYISRYGKLRRPTLGQLSKVDSMKKPRWPVGERVGAGGTGADGARSVAQSTRVGLFETWRLILQRIYGLAFLQLELPRHWLSFQA
jgi:hypothetical protein